MKKILLIISLLLYLISVKAQPFTLDKKFKPVQLKLHKFNPPKEPKAKGRISISEITQTKDTLFYFVKDASIYSPVYVGLQTNGSAGTVDISLHKLSWKKAERQGATDAKGYWQDLFKTENDFGIRVIVKDKPAAYTMMVWVGDEPRMELPSVFKKGGVIINRGNFFKDNLLYIIIAGLVIFVVILFLKLKNKNK